MGKSLILCCLVVIIVFVNDIILIAGGRSLVKMEKDGRYLKKRRSFRTWTFVSFLLTIGAVGIGVTSSFLVGGGAASSLYVVSQSLYALELIGLFLVPPVLRKWLGPIFGYNEMAGIEHCNLYLRSFDSDKQKTVIADEKRICDSFRCVSRTYAIGSPNEVLPKLGVDRIYATDFEWQSLISTLLEKAHIVILRVSETEGCKWEMHQCVSYKYLEKTIFLVQDGAGAEQLEKAVNSIGIVGKLRFSGIVNNLLAVIYDAKNQKWIVSEISSKKSLQEFRTMYLESHPELLNLANEYNEHRSHVLKYLFKHLDGYKNYNSGRIGFLGNPFYYMGTNEWKLSYKLLFISLWVLLLIIFAIGIMIGSIDLMSFGGIFVLIHFLFFFIFGPKISFLSHRYPGVSIFKIENQFMNKWILLFFTISSVFSVLSMSAIFEGDLNGPLLPSYPEFLQKKIDKLYETKYVTYVTQNGSYSFELDDMFVREFDEEGDMDKVYVTYIYTYPSVSISREPVSEYDYSLEIYAESVRTSCDPVESFEKDGASYRISFYDVVGTDSTYYQLKIVQKDDFFYVCAVDVAQLSHSLYQHEIDRICNSFKILK